MVNGLVKIRVGDMEYDIKPHRRDEIMAILAPVGTTGVPCAEVAHMGLAQKHIDTTIQTLLNSPGQARGKRKDKIKGIWIAEDDKMATITALNQASAIVNRQVAPPEPPPEPSDEPEKAEESIGELVSGAGQEDSK